MLEANRPVSRILPICTSEEFFDGGYADYIEVSVDKEVIDWCKKAIIAIKDLGASSISRFDDPEYFYDEDAELSSTEEKAYKECDVLVETCKFTVTEFGVEWSGCYKHSDTRWVSESISLKEIEENWEVLNSKVPPKKLKYESSKEMIKIRGLYEDKRKAPLSIRSNNPIIKRLITAMLENNSNTKGE